MFGYATNDLLYLRSYSYAWQTLHGVRWNNPTDENDARRIQEHFEQLAQFGLCLDRGMIDQRLAVLIEEQKNTASKPTALSAKADSGKVLNVTEADDASSVSSAVVSVGGPRASVPPSLPMPVGDLNLRPDEEQKFRQFFVTHVRKVPAFKPMYLRIHRCMIS